MSERSYEEIQRAVDKMNRRMDRRWFLLYAVILALGAGLIVWIVVSS